MFDVIAAVQKYEDMFDVSLFHVANIRKKVGR